MIPADIFRRIRTIQIRSSRKVNEFLAGSWHSAFKGRGIEFEEVRPYYVGDDVRAIDWNVTARTNQPHVKLFREEREMSVMLLVDISRSLDFGSTHQTKRELVTELGATLAMSAIKNNDLVGLTLFSSELEKHIRPGKGSKHVLRIIRELLYCQPVGQRTKISVALEHLNRTCKRRSVVFLISDFLDEGFERLLRISRKKHDVVPIVISDPLECELPNVGLVRLQDRETGQTVLVDTSSRQNRVAYREHYLAQTENRDDTFRRLGVSPIRMQTGDDLVAPLQAFFRKREQA